MNNKYVRVYVYVYAAATIAAATTTTTAIAAIQCENNKLIKELTIYFLTDKEKKV